MWDHHIHLTMEGTNPLTMSQLLHLTMEGTNPLTMSQLLHMTMEGTNPLTMSEGHTKSSLPFRRYPDLENTKLLPEVLKLHSRHF